MGTHHECIFSQFILLSVRGFQMTIHIQIVARDNEACVVLAKKWCWIPIPGKTFYFMEGNKISSRFGPVWMPLKEAQLVYQSICNEQRNIKEKAAQLKAKTRKKTVMEATL
jgi:hypothetical protein